MPKKKVKHIGLGRLYYDFLTKNSSKEIASKIKENSADISLESQKVYSLIPFKYQYDNSDKICKQLCILSTSLFLQNSLKNYASLFSGVLTSLSTNKYKLLTTIRSDVSQKMLGGYSIDSKFIRVQDVSANIMTHAKELENGQKASIIFVVGGHAIDVMMLKKGDRVTFIYYDPYQGQLYKQTVAKLEIEKALDNISSFLHPYSILNKNGIMLGKLSIFEDSILDINIPYVLETFITSTKYHSINNDISFANNVDPTQLIKYLAGVPAMFNTMIYISNPVGFKKFLKEYGDDILSEMNNAKSCTGAMSSCNEYLSEVLRGFYGSYHGLENDIRTSYSRISLDPKLSSFPKSARHNADLCIKETKTYSDDGKALRNFYKILLEDKEALTEPMHKCFNKTTLSAKKKFVQETCNHFKTVDPEPFAKAHEAYYPYMDTRYQNYKENCIDSSKFDSDLHLIGTAHTEL